MLQLLQQQAFLPGNVSLIPPRVANMRDAAAWSSGMVSGATGITQSFVFGVYQGVPYYDWTVSGNPSATDQCYLGSTGATADVIGPSGSGASGAVHEYSCWAAWKSQASPVRPSSWAFASDLFNGTTYAATEIGSSVTSTIPVNVAAPQRISQRITQSAAATHISAGFLLFDLVNGTTYSFTVRVFRPSILRVA